MGIPYMTRHERLRRDPITRFAHLDGSAHWLQVVRDATLARQIEIAGIAAPTGAETRRGAVMEAALSRVGGLDVRRDDVGNVIARLRSVPAGRPAREAATRHETAGDVDEDTTAPGARVNDGDVDAAPIVVLAHLDTVFEELMLPEARFDGPRVYASGIGDNGRGLSALITLAEALQRPELWPHRTHPIELVATVGEEGAGNLRGARHYFEQRALSAAPTPVAAIALDGPGDSLIVHHAIASRRVRFTFSGPGGHPWADQQAANAAHAVGRAIASIAQLASSQASGIAVTVTRMGGGESLTSVPASAWFDVDIRTIDQRSMSRVSDAVHRVVERARAESCGPRSVLTVTTELLGDRPGGALDILHPLVQLADTATRWQGIEPQSASASSDANIPLSRGIPAITIGAGGHGGGAHTAHEWYDDTHGTRGIARALAVVLGAGRCVR